MGGRGGKKGRKQLGYVPALAVGLGAGFLTDVGLLILTSLAVARLGWEWGLKEWVVLLITFLSCFLGGTVCTRLSPGRKLPMAVACGLIWLLLWLGLGWLIQGEVSTSLLTGSGAAALLGAITAGVFAANRKNNGK